jgi:uncharacterized protein (DUF1810 family)
MNAIYQNRFTTDTRPTLNLRTLQRACTPCYQAIIDQLSAIRSRVERKFSQAVSGYEEVLRSALAEAEALAWQTPYPHLLFPALAEEKAASVQKWAAHQREVYAREQIRAFAA